MLIVPIENFLALVGLIVLLGSIFGSAYMYLSGGTVDHTPRATLKYGDDWRGPRVQVPVYITSKPTEAKAPRRFIGLVSTIAIAFVVGFSLLFAAQSPWSFGTDLRHLASSLHCGAAQQLGLAQANVGGPGYHPRLDPDRNGVSCDSPALQSAGIPVENTRSLSNQTLVWPK